MLLVDESEARASTRRRTASTAQRSLSTLTLTLSQLPPPLALPALLFPFLTHNPVRHRQQRPAEHLSEAEAEGSPESHM